MGPFGNLAKPRLPSNIANQHCQTQWDLLATLPNQGCQATLPNQHCQTQWDLLATLPNQGCQATLPNQHCQTHWDLLATLPNQGRQATLPTNIAKLIGTFWQPALGNVAKRRDKVCWLAMLPFGSSNAFGNLGIGQEGRQKKDRGCPHLT